MHSIMIPDNCYGPSTSRIRSTIAKCQDVHWFAPANQTIALKNTVFQHVQVFLSRMRILRPDMQTRFDLNWIEGDWSLLHQHRWGDDPHLPWGHRFDDSMALFGEIVRNIKSKIINSPRLLSFIKSPLWPIGGNPDVSGVPIIAHEDVFRDAGLNLQYGSSDWSVAWGLLCLVEFYVWSHLLHDLLGDASVGTNPFEPLLDICVTGCFPLGWHDSCFYIFRWGFNQNNGNAL